MDDIRKRLSDLIAYANIHLSVDTADNQFLFLKLCEIAGVSPAGFDNYAADADFLEKQTNADAILSGLDSRMQSLLLAAVLPPPSRIIEIFSLIILEGGGMREAADWLYDFSVKSGYVPLAAADHNIHWRAPGKKGALHITINTALTFAEGSPYDSPRCLMCPSPELSPLTRVLPVCLNGDDWLFRFSANCLFSQHFVFYPAQHRAARDFSDAFGRLIDAIEYFPHYFFFESFADSDKTKAGGHFCLTGGLPDMPLFSAPPRMAFTDPGRGVSITVPDWYNTVIRIESGQRTALSAAVCMIHDAFAAYSGERIGLVNPAGKNIRILPVLRINGSGEYCAELMLLNSRLAGTGTDLLPLGIGAAEALGAFMLSADVGAAAAAVTGQADAGALSPAAARLASGMSSALPEDGDIAGHIEEYILSSCEDALSSSAVFREDGAGNIALIEFMTGLGYAIKQ